MKRQSKLVLLSFICSCGIPGLSGEDVYGKLEPASLSGIVSDSKTGAPLGGATVLVESQSTVSGDDGTYTLTGLSGGGTASGSASRIGYQADSFTLKLADGTNQYNVSLTPISCQASGCSSGNYCDTASGNCEPSGGSAELSGAVTDACTGVQIGARVAIGGWATCSSSTKPYYRITQLAAGGPQALAAGKSGYQSYVANITLNAGFNVQDIALTPEGGCIGTPPVDVPCTCNESYCQVCVSCP
jgi:hypothetical protein